MEREEENEHVQKMERKRRYEDWPYFSLTYQDFLEILSGISLNIEFPRGE